MDELAFSSDELINLSRWFKVMGEPNRLLLLEKIIEGVQCNCELGFNLQMAPNLISHHLAVLKEAGLIEAERDLVDARWVYYSINPVAMKELGSLFGKFFDANRIQPRRLSCGPQMTDDQQKSLIRMTK